MFCATEIFVCEFLILILKGFCYESYEAKFEKIKTYKTALLENKEILISKMKERRKLK